MRLISAALLLWAMTGASSADPAMDCGATAGSQVEIADCLAKTEAAADQAMATALQIARDAAGEVDTATGRAEARPALDAAQAAFLGFRDSQCAAVGAMFGGGSGTGIAIRGCRIEMTRDRTGALVRFGR
jgi:uncharacterized protein YecT (DUF1311 family)